MLRKFQLLVVAGLLFVSQFLMAAPVNYGVAKVAKVISIYDADTFRVNIEGWPSIVGENISIRVSGIDAPEIRGKCPEEKQAAQRAKQKTVDLITAASNIELKNMVRGKYFRIVADVYVDGINLSNRLVELGHAVAYDGGTKISWCD